MLGEHVGDIVNSGVMLYSLGMYRYILIFTKPSIHSLLIGVQVMVTAG